MKRVVEHIEKYSLVMLDGCFYKNKNIFFGGISKLTICVNRIRTYLCTLEDSLFEILDENKEEKQKAKPKNNN